MSDTVSVKEVAKFKQKIFEAVDSRFQEDDKFVTQESKKAVNEFLFNENCSDEDAEKDFVDWFLFSRVIPSKGKTFAEIELESAGERKEIRDVFFQMREVVWGEFEITEIKNGILTMADEKGKIYEVVDKFVNEAFPFQKGEKIKGRIHPFGKDKYLTSGILERKPVRIPGLIYPEDIEGLMDMIYKSRIKEIENVTVFPGKKFTAVLNTYPSEWIDGICSAIGINPSGKKKEKVKCIAEALCKKDKLQKIVGKLPEKSIEVLRMVLSEGGWVKYGVISKKFTDDMSFFWDEEKVKSDIGLLRLHGLLAVGKTPISGRMYKIAFVPKEIRNDLHEILSINKK